MDTDFLTRTTDPRILQRLERILLGGFLCALCVLAENAGQHSHREDAKDAKKTLSGPKLDYWFFQTSSSTRTRVVNSFPPAESLTR